MKSLSRIFFLLSLIPFLYSVNTGFWYGGDRGPLSYDSVPFANCTVKINMEFEVGPGQKLFRDPYNRKNSIFVGNTLNRQSFDTQFVLDLQYALGISSDRIYVTQVIAGNVHFSWESSNVIVYFMLLERNVTEYPIPNIQSQLTLIQAIAKLEALIQTNTSRIFLGTNVTSALDPLYGLEVITWDNSLRLLYSIESIGGNSVIDNYYLNYGGLGFCDQYPLAIKYTKYCEFERFFEDDLSEALDLSYFRIQILFIKKASLDSVLIHFRILPQDDHSGVTISLAMANLIIQVQDQTSDLYKGNVTLRTDPSWGVSGNYQVIRNSSALFTKKYYNYNPRHINSNLQVPEYRRPPSFITPYHRCKENRRCNWGITHLNQSTNEIRYYQQLFEDGQLFPVQLFLDFEDWRSGARGFTWSGITPPTESQQSIPGAHAAAMSRIRGAHFWPFDTPALGPVIPAYRSEKNEGLVLDRALHHRQLGIQQSLVYDLSSRLDWMEENIEWAVMGADLRSRKDVRRYMTNLRGHYYHWYLNEVQELHELNSSQCAQTACVIHFDTSTLSLTGAINVTGVVMNTSQGTEVAVFNFNSIYLGPEVKVILTGQRALALISRTTAIINCSIIATPGTLGGFLGGYSVSRLRDETLVDHPRDILMCALGGYCVNSSSENVTIGGDVTPPLTVREFHSLKSYNVNGPGSGNLLIYPFLIKTSATNIPEIQIIQTTAKSGQSLSGGFILEYGAYKTPLISHDVSAFQLKDIMEDSLNLDNPNNLQIHFNRYTEDLAGIGLVNVSRSSADAQGGCQWYVTFTTAVGNIPELLVYNYLEGDLANVNITTYRNGNELLGTFKVIYNGHKTPPIHVNDSALDVKRKLLQLPDICTVFVDRIDPTANCKDGLCENGPYPANGLVWTVYATVNSTHGNITPRSPSEVLHYADDYFIRPVFTLDGDDITGVGAAISLDMGLKNSRNDECAKLDIQVPFSIAFGGAGGSHGGTGGAGYGQAPAGPLYGQREIPDLLGGSGGALRGQDIFENNAFLARVAGRGGHGGGAIEIIAANDIVIGNFGIISVSGGDAEQSSEGGGGGGSGGSIVLAAGGNVLVNGVLTAKGGHGGYGGVNPYILRDRYVSAAGGGGGGGRIAMYGESIVLDDSVVSSAGGRCGVWKEEKSVSVHTINVTVDVFARGYLDDSQIEYVTELFLNRSFLPIANYFEDIVSSGPPDTFQLTFLLAFPTNTSLNFLQNIAKSSQDTIVGDVIMRFLNISGFKLSNLTLPHWDFSRTVCESDGEEGTVYTEAMMTTNISVSDGKGFGAGAENTTRALYIRNNEMTVTESGSIREAPFPWNGPIISFPPAKPTRVSYYTKTEDIPNFSKRSQFFSLFTLISRGEPDLNITSVIGIYFGEYIKHGSNFEWTPDEQFYLDRLASIDDYPVLNQWYKIDIHLRWDLMTYNILLNDELVVQNHSFKATQLDGIRLSVYRAVHVWFDEIYVGFDSMMRFTCPITTRRGPEVKGPPQKAWSADEVFTPGSRGLSEDYPMNRHYNFLDDVKLVKFDGEGHQKLNEDIKLKFKDGDYPTGPAKLHAGALKYLSQTGRSFREPLSSAATTVNPLGLWTFGNRERAGDGRFFWYIEHSHNESQTYPKPSDFDLRSYLDGGVAACSTQDLKTWRFEGIVLHYHNLSDMVYGTHGPFSLERPTVIFNKHNSEYVLYATMNEPAHTLGMTAIATSPYEDGPFLFRRSMYPDGNKTRDQIAFVNDEGRPVLARTYYATVEYLMPEAIMQPVWESVKFRNGTTFYSLNYHRAYYNIGYDNYHDIYLQRWRLEDQPWEVYCVNRITEEKRYIPYGTINVDGDVCQNPDEDKLLIGQGNPFIKSRFLDPNVSDNSWWVQTSVPGVKAQPWANNYEDGLCGIRKLNDDHDVLDPELESFEPVDHSQCSNIADNPVHSALQDKLIGVMRVVTSRRAKYLAASELTSDYLDTNGITNSVEGEFNNGHLISMITNLGQFGFGPGRTIGSTFLGPVRSEFNTSVDHRIRFRQYISNFNDRAKYALGCILDGVCSVNYKDQLVDGQK